MNEKIIINNYNNLDLKIAFWHKRSDVVLSKASDASSTKKLLWGGGEWPPPPPPVSVVCRGYYVNDLLELQIRGLNNGPKWVVWRRNGRGPAGALEPGAQST